MDKDKIKKLEKKIKELKAAKKLSKTKGGEVEGSAEALESYDPKPITVINSAREVREDIGDRVKTLVTALAKEGDYRFAQFAGTAGGKRKVYECPNPECKEKFLVAGVKGTRKPNPDRKQTPNQKAWMDFVDKVHKLDEYKGGSRTKAMKAAGKLKEEGFTIEDLDDYIKC